MTDQPDGPQRVPWKITDVAIATAVIFATFLVLLLALGVVMRSLVTEDQTRLAPWFFGIFEGLMLAAVWIFGIRKYRASWRTVGLKRATGRGVRWLPWLALLASLLFTFLYSTIVTRLGIDFLVPEQDITGEILGEGFTRFLNTVIIGLWGPFTEEVFFRGFLLAALITPLGAVRAVLISSAVFAAAHLQIATLIPIFVTGTLLAWLYIKTGSLWPPVIAHAAQNLLALTFAPQMGS